MWLAVADNCTKVRTFANQKFLALTSQMNMEAIPKLLKVRIPFIYGRFLIIYVHQGVFQLLDLIITELKSHMTCYNSMPLIG